MKTNTIITLVLMALFSTIATAMPAVINEVEIDGTTLTQDTFTTLSIDRDQDYQVKITFTAQEKLRSAEIRAYIAGYEHNDVDSIEDTTDVFDAEPSITYTKKLNIRIPSDADKDTYKLRIILSDRTSETLTQSYNLKVDLPRNSLRIDDVILSPSYGVKAGSALIGSVRIENSGDRDQDDVRVTLTIPELGLSDTKYINEIETDDEEETEEFYLRIPKCTQAKSYDLFVDVEYSNRHRKTTDRQTITILADENCANTQTQNSMVATEQQTQTVLAGETATYTITLTNGATTSKTFNINTQQTTWATTSITPSQTLVLQPGQTQTVFVNVQTNKKTEGTQSLLTTIEYGNEKKEITLIANVTPSGSLKDAFEIILVVLIVALVIVGILIGINRFRNGDQPETYY